MKVQSISNTFSVFASCTVCASIFVTTDVVMPSTQLITDAAPASINGPTQPGNPLTSGVGAMAPNQHRRSFPASHDLRSWWVTIRDDPTRTHDEPIEATSQWAAGWLYRMLHPGAEVIGVRPASRP